MEEGPEAHMETDVSSTTEDVPETQEVTGSNGNVEMVIVVEKVSEEQMNTTEQTDIQPTPIENKVNNVSKTPIKSPLKDVQAQTSVKTLNKDEPPKLVQKSPTKSETQKKIVVKDTLIIKTPQPAAMKLAEPVDSSIIINDQKLIVECKEKSVDSSLKDLEVQKITKNTPTKDGEPQDSTKTTPVKGSIVADKSSLNGKVQSTVMIEQDVEASTSITTITPINITIEKETSNDSQIELNTESSEKDHNKSISRELKSLINSAKESKIISECTQLTSKTRKSRVALDSSLNSSVEADKIQGNRRSSNNSQKSNCSEKSEKVTLKRSMRSQNPEFVNKVKLFLNSVTSKVQKDSDISDDDMDYCISKEKVKKEKEKVKEIDLNDSMASIPKKKKLPEEPAVQEKSNKLRTDPYCWRCHWAVEQTVNDKIHSPMQCTVCPRSFHFKCLSGTERNRIITDKNWVCPECLLVLHAESSDTRSHAMKKISLGKLCELLKFALERMLDLNGVEPFMNPVDRAAFPDYDKYVVHPMDLSLMKENIADGLYGSTEAFLADAQWILHNSIIFNTLQSKLTGGARALVRYCRAEMGEVEACPECYAAAHARRPTWFTDVCSTPHVLLWAKLKGFPYWPAKGMSVNSNGLVDVRFFGAHDRAWVPAKDCFLYSEKDPNNFRTKRQDILDSMQEAEQHIRNISRKYGKFVYPPFKTQFDPTKLYEQLRLMIPSFEGEVKNLVKEKLTTSPNNIKEKSRSNSKSSKGSMHEGYMSESEETPAMPSRKMADGAEIAREEDDATEKADKDKTMEVDKPQSKELQSKDTEPISTRKRRRSELEEAVITIMETSSPAAEKKKRVDEVKKDEKKDVQEPSSSKEIIEKPKVNVDKPKMTVEKLKVTVGTPKDTVETSKDTIVVGATTANKAGEVTLKVKDNEPSSSTTEKDSTPKVPPIKISLTPRTNKQTSKPNTPKDSTPKTNTPNEKSTPNRQKPGRLVKSMSCEKIKDDKSKSEKRRISRNKSHIIVTNLVKSEKKIEKSADSSTINKEKAKENNTTAITRNKEANKSTSDKIISSKTMNAESPKSSKDRLKFDDDTSLAVLARGSKNIVVSSSATGLPTISSVRSLSTAAQNITANSTKTTTTQKCIEITVEANTESSIFTPTSTNNVRNMSDAVNKLQKLRSDTEPVVGRVGVRAFARMTSPPAEKQNKPDDVQVEIKAEPIDLDEPERHSEKMDLMNAFRLRPVVPQPTNLREVRINKVVVTPLNGRNATKPPEVRPRAKKTFPQPKKNDDGRSELNSKNSMVYIPIQPPMTQAPVRAVRPAANGSVTSPVVRPTVPIVTSTANNLVNTVTTPMLPTVITSTLSSPSATSAPTSMPTQTQSLPTVGQVPTVHTVPLVTSLNGQLMFSLHPVMSVGSIENASSPPMVNGLSDRSPAPPLHVGGNPLPALMPTAANLPTIFNTANCRTSVDNALGEPPRLQQRPALLNPLDSSTPIGCVPPPSTAGPLTAKLNQNAVKLTDFFRTLLEDSLEKLDEPASQATTLRLQLEQARWRHAQEIDEIKHNHDLTLAEMRASFEKEKLRAVSEVRRSTQVELEAAVKLAKSKQWCANCSQEAQFYCCWNTSYCDYPCQRAHWSQHFSLCTQQRAQDGNESNEDGTNQPESRLQPQPDNLPKSALAPTLTVGGKLAPPRAFTQEQQNTQKASIIVSMVENASGNQVKCVGTYKQPESTQMSPLLLNKQIMNNEDNAAKKVVTSGGYLIVGAGAPHNTSVVTPSRRTHTIQYYT